jgi:hypothetical protein
VYKKDKANQETGEKNGVDESVTRFIKRFEGFDPNIRPVFWRVFLTQFWLYHIFRKYVLIISSKLAVSNLVMTYVNHIKSRLKKMLGKYFLKKVGN